MIAIREEIRRIEKGELDAADNPLKNAPHTLEDLVDGDWRRSYTPAEAVFRSEEHTSELQSLMRISYAVFCLKKKSQKKIKSIQYTKTTTDETQQNNYRYKQRLEAA